jgi:hypothetical protein
MLLSHPSCVFYPDPTSMGNKTPDPGSESATDKAFKYFLAQKIVTELSEI